MSLPKFEEFLYPFLLMIKDSKKNIREIRSGLIKYFNLSESDCKAKTKSGNTYRLDSNINWARQYLRRAIFIDMPQRGIYTLTERGRDYITRHSSLTENDLKQYPEFAEYVGSEPVTNVPKADKLNENWLELVEILKTENFINKPPEQQLLILKSWFRGLNWKTFNGSLKLLEFNDKTFLFLDNIAQNIQFAAYPDTKDTGLSEHCFEMGCKFTLSIGSTINVFFQSDAQNPLCSITLEPKSIDGNELCKCIEYDNCNNGNIEAFYAKRYVDNSSKAYLHSLLDLWSSDNTDLIKIIKDYFVSEGFEEEEVLEELNLFDFSIISKINTKDRSHIAQNSRDTTRYSIDNGKSFFNKRRFVLHVIRRFVKEHPGCTMRDLEKAFPSEIISKKRGVVRPLKLVESWVVENPDVAKRYFLDSKDVISLQDGTKVVVHNQWGTSFPNFIRVISRMYNVIDEQGNVISSIKEQAQTYSEDGRITITSESLKNFSVRK